jgi:hypothetical protein
VRSYSGQIGVLSEDGMDGHLERPPGTRTTDAGSNRHQRSDRRIVGKVCHGRTNVGVDAHHPPGSLDDVDQAFPIREVGTEKQVVLTPWVHLQHTRPTVQANRSTVDTVLDRFHARHGAVGEERDDAVPVERRLEREPHGQPAVRGEPVGSTPTATKLAGRGPEHLAHGAIELAEAPKPGRERNIGDGQLGIVQEPAGEVGTTGPSQLIGSHAEVVVEQAPKMPRRDPEPCPEVRLCPFVEHSVDDELHRAAHQLGSVLGDGAGDSVGAAAQTGAETCGLGRSRQLERTDVLG